MNHQSGVLPESRENETFLQPENTALWPRIGCHCELTYNTTRRNLSNDAPSSAPWPMANKAPTYLYGLYDLYIFMSQGIARFPQRSCLLGDISRMRLNNRIQ